MQRTLHNAIGSLAILIVTIVSGYGQVSPKSPVFSLPANATAADYQMGLLLAKLKPEYRGMVSVGSGSARSRPLPDVTMQPLANTAAYRKNQSARATEFKVDLSLYVKLIIPPSADIEKKINELYATGYFEIIEPSYLDKIDFIPNDPLAAANQYYLGLIRANEAWDVSKSDAQTVIAIVDTGGDLKHPDLAGNLYTNFDEIPNNNIDDDGDGFIDNIQGWDFMGADTLNLYNSSFTGDNDPQLKLTGDPGALGHGVVVAGCASASTNNGIGVSGVGYNAKLLFTKHTADNQRVAAPGIYFGYSGILYAAQTLTADNIPRKIINCSWGGKFRSQIAQDIINHVTLDLGCLVVAAAGNNGSKAPNYPSSYDHVLSVAATDQQDTKASFSSFGPTVDVAAPGVSIFSTANNNGYTSLNGTSFSSPMVAGAAALVWSHYATFTPQQVAEQIRISADNVDTKNPNFAQQLGRGRINIKNALALTMPSVRVSGFTLLSAQGNSPSLGQESWLTMDFTNYLQSTTGGFTVTASSTSPWVTFSRNQIVVGVITEGTAVRNALNPIKLSISTNTPENTIVQIELDFIDGGYSDFQSIELLINPSYINVDENKVATTIASTGRIGFDDPANSEKGVGFVFKDNPILFEMGLIMGTSPTNLFNNVRGTSGQFEQDFRRVNSIQKIVPGERTSAEILGSFSPATLSDLAISYRSLVMRESPSPNDKFVIMEYTLKNNSAVAITNFRFGIFADWDISDSGVADAAGWDASRQIGYVYPKQSTALPHAGVQLLNQPATYYAIDNSEKIPGNPFGLYDGFTRDEKFTSISQQRLTAGETTPAGNDVSHVVSAAAVNLPAGGEVVLAFALHAANNLTDLLASADAANTLYNVVFNLPKPSVAPVETCYGTNATLQATGASTFNWYNSFTGGLPLQSGPSFTLTNLYADTVLYVSSTDNTYESIRTPAPVIIKADPTISASPSSKLCAGQSAVLSVNSADEYSWSNGSTSRSISVNMEGTYSVTVKYNALNCTSSSTPVSVKVNPLPTADFSSQGELRPGIPISFTDLSVGGITRQWEFGDGSTSSEANPTKVYSTSQNYTVSLLITSANGCVGAISKPLDVITGLEDHGSTIPTIYPNPANDYLFIEVDPTNDATVALTSLYGQTLLGVVLSEGKGTAFVGNLADGMYLLRIASKTGQYTQKVIIRR